MQAKNVADTNLAAKEEIKSEIRQNTEMTAATKHMVEEKLERKLQQIQDRFLGIPIPSNGHGHNPPTLKNIQEVVEDTNKKVTTITEGEGDAVQPPP
jgi:hypothetical protein